MRIKSRLAFIFLYFGLTLFSTAQAQEVEISLDRNEIARGETVTLTIRIYDQRQGMQLDLTPLTSQFDVLGTRTSSQIRSVNGAVAVPLMFSSGIIRLPSSRGNSVTM